MASRIELSAANAHQQMGNWAIFFLNNTELINLNIFSIQSAENDAVCLKEVGSKPATTQECNRDVKNCPKYHLGPWKPCDKLCGEGKETRKVTCFIEENGHKRKLADEDCVEDKPEEERSCLLAPCEGVDWIVSQWSGVSKILNLIVYLVQPLLNLSVKPAVRKQKRVQQFVDQRMERYIQTSFVDLRHQN